MPFSRERLWEFALRSTKDFPVMPQHRTSVASKQCRHKRGSGGGERNGSDGPLPTRCRAAAESGTAESFGAGKGQLVHDAFDLVKNARAKGRKHWTGLSRDELHNILAALLSEPSASAVFRGRHDQIAARSHSGMRLGSYVEFGARISLRSAPERVDPFPLQALGYILDKNCWRLCCSSYRTSVPQRGAATMKRLGALTQPALRANVAILGGLRSRDELSSRFIALFDRRKNGKRPDREIFDIRRQRITQTGIECLVR